MKTLRSKVTWAKNDELECVILGAQGFSTKMIMERTGLSFCQVNYRLHKATIKRADYRNGHSDVAEQVLSRTRNLSDQAIRSILKLRVIK